LIGAILLTISCFSETENITDLQNDRLRLTSAQVYTVSTLLSGKGFFMSEKKEHLH